jgi:hypothetical protein
MTCWSCRAENNLDQRQTCVRCGAPLEKAFSLFQRPIVLGAASLLAFGWLAVVVWALFLHGCR